MQYPIGLTCQQLIELVTDYFEDSLDADERARFELHLSVCPGCVDYLQQMRDTIRATGGVRADVLGPTVRDVLLDVFRTWKKSTDDSY